MFSMCGIISSLLLSILITRLLSVESRGELQFYLTGAQAAVLFGSFGIPFARALIEARENIVLSNDSDLFFILPSVIFFSYVYSSFYHIEFDSIIYTLLVISFLIYLYALERTKNARHLELYSKLYVVNPLIIMFVFYMMWLNFIDITIEVVLFSYVISNILSSAFWYLRNKGKSKFGKKLGIRTIAIKIWVNNIFSYFANNIDKLVVFKVLSITEVSVYYVLFSLASIINKVFERISVNILGMFQAGNIDVKWLIKWLNVTTVFFIPLIYLTITNVGNTLIIFIFGKEYSGYPNVLFYIVISSIFTSYSWMLAQRLLADLNILANSIRTVGSTFVFILALVCFSFIHEVDISNVALSYLLACIYRYISTLILVFYYEKVKEKIIIHS
ncbi:hypothetical protein [Photobacterium phosphoreum]|uniref:hypothetical protein n=1 Tax=Photobacterium phosphoreum TaxID=659 RepID=UPI0039AEA325